MALASPISALAAAIAAGTPCRADRSRPARVGFACGRRKPRLRNRPDRRCKLPRPMIAGMVPDAWIQEAASKLIEQHGADAKTEVERLLSVVITQRNQHR